MVGLGVVISILFTVCPDRSIADTSASRVSDNGSLLERFLAFDSAFLRAANAEAVAQEIARYRERLVHCASSDLTLGERETCVLDALFAADGLDGLDGSSSPLESSVTWTLINGSGSCAALVATVLAFSEDVGSAFNALILRDHVLLVSARSPHRRFELLEKGRLLSEPEFLNHQPFPPGGPEEVGPEAFVAYYLDNLAARFAEAGEPEKAERVFKRALDIAPKSGRVHYNLGTFLLQSERYVEAEGELSRAIRLGWKDATAYVNRGAARWRLGRARAARRDFRKALELDPNNREAAVNLRHLSVHPASLPE